MQINRGIWARPRHREQIICNIYTLCAANIAIMSILQMVQIFSRRSVPSVRVVLILDDKCFNNKKYL